MPRNGPAVSNTTYCSMRLLLVLDIIGLIHGQSGQRLKTSSVRRERQSNDGETSGAPTAVYYKLRRILKPSNQNGSAVMSSSPLFHPPSTPSPLPISVQSSPFLSQHRPGLPLGRTETGVMAPLLPHTVFGCSSHGPLLKGHIIN